ncbi:type III secretion protein [Shewanella psychropiezotolerans]|uniref:Type III secretion protein n=1 Tax=Shewanella psychropiezotolerans TaxID=2593655 RepID=A0ABX5WYQ5_9GAMM|nr:type III secretion protein [Shewanella psychropiezotolerans]QDO84235.1 type III secretion protein [Shewanella psychropiezotolerans]
MNPFLIKVQTCGLSRKGSNWVSDAELVRAASVTTLEQDARRRIAQIIKKARKQRDDAQERAKEILEQASEQAEMLRAQWQKEAKEQAIAEAIDWHFDEAQLTQAVMDKLKASIAGQIKSVLKAWTLEQEPSPFLIKRLSDQVSERVGLEAVSLLVAADDYEAMAQAFEGRMNVEVSPDLLSGQAELSSTSLTARVDLAEHLDLLLETFVAESRIKSVGT